MLWREQLMATRIGRREFLRSSAACVAIGATTGLSGVAARAARLEAPLIDKLSVRVLVDSSFDLFFKPAEVGGVRTEAPPRTDYRSNLHNEWGLSLFLETQRAAEQRTLMLDFGYSAPVLLNNIAISGVR